MPRFDPVQSNFTGGEFGPRLLGNFELEKYKQGLKTLENFLVQPSGGVSRRGGFKYVAEVKDSSKITILHEFNYKDEFSYILEFGDLYIRFYRNQAQIIDGSAVEVVTPYLEADLTNLRFSSDGEILLITHNDYVPAILTRTSHTDWDLSLMPQLSYTYEWDAKTAAEINDWESVCWSPELDLFCAVASDGTNRVMTSPDGVTWTARAAAEANYWMSVCWSPKLTLFCAVALDGTNRVMTSPDGTTWTARAASEANEWQYVCWSPKLELFCAISYTGTNRVMTSPDGTTWTARAASEANGWRSVCWSPELELFCAVSDDGTNRVMTSPDGTTWTARAASEANSWWSICWSPELTLFCAVSITGTNRVMTSPDGINWTARTAAEANEWRSICWSPEIEIFHVVARDGTNRTMSSVDGITWAARSPSVADTDWYSVCWSPELELFCAVGQDNTTDLVMVSMNTGYPALSLFFEQRLFLISSTEDPNRVRGSQSGDYYNFHLGTGLDNEGIDIKIKEATKLLWATTSNVIMLGAHNAEFKLAANSLNEALTPTNIRPVKCTSYGSMFLPALEVDGNVLFTQRGARKIRRLEYEMTKDKHKAINITILSEHITESGLIDIACINGPDSLIWGVRDDGQLACLTYEPEYQIYGWSRHVIGGTNVKVKSIAVSDAITANEDELWAIISRTVNSATVQYVEFLKQGLTSEDDIEDAFFVDSGVTKTGSDFTTFDGLDHLEGETVLVLADGSIQASKIVASGEITITAADKAHAGLQYDSILETLPIEGGNPIGSAMGKIKRISKVVLRLYKSLKFILGDLLDNTSETVILDTSLYTGDSEELDFHGTHETGGQIKILINDPIPFTLLAIMYKARTGE